MRILVDARICRRWDAGTGRYVRELVNNMSRLEQHDYVLVVPRSAPGGLPRPIFRDSVTVYESDIPVASAPQHVRWPIFMRSLRPDVILISHPLTAPLVAPAPMAVAVLDLYPLAFPRQFPWYVSLYYRSVFAIVARQRQLLAISEATKTDITRRYRVRPDRITVTHLAADSHFQPVPDSRERAAILRRYGVRPGPFVLYHGNKRPHKNLGRLVCAFALVARHHDAQLVITGRQDASDRECDFSEIHSAVAENGLASRVVLTGPVNDEDLPALYSAAALTAIPSLSEGFGLPAIESLACGTPVVASDRGALPEVVGDAGLLVNPLDVGGIAAAIRKILVDVALAEELRRRALLRTKSFSWAQTAQQTLDCLHSLVSA